MEHILAKISIMLVPALLAITAHEVAHGFLADKLGDPTARLLGRLTLNPFKHLDPIGTVALLFVGFGWARPVPVNFNNLSRPKKDMIWVALAGPLTNFGLALLSVLLLKVLVYLGKAFPDGSLAQVFQPLSLMAAFSLYINVILAVFNLLPIPPLDGGRVAVSLLPSHLAARYAMLEPYGLMILVLLLFSGILGTVIGPVIGLTVNLIVSLFGI